MSRNTSYGTAIPSRKTVGTALVVALLVLAGCSGGGAGGDGGDGSASGGRGAAPAADSGGSGSDGGTGGNAGTGDRTTPGFGSYYDDQGNRVVIRSGEIRVQVDDFGKAFREVRAVVRDSGGYVGNRERTGEGQYDEGFFVIHVPAQNFSVVWDAVASQGRVQNEDVSAEDFTKRYQSQQSRLQELRRDERRLERALANASEDASEIRSQLQDVRQKRRKLERKASSLDRRASMSTIRVELREPATNRPPENRETLAGFTDAFYEAFYGGLGAVRFFLVLVGYAIPLGFVTVLTGVVGGGAVWGYHRYLRPLVAPLTEALAPGTPQEQSRERAGTRRQEPRERGGEENEGGER